MSKKGKRPNGEGYLRQRPNGLWELTVMVGWQVNGKRKYQSFYGRSQKEVREKAQAYLHAKASGFAVDKTYYFGEWADLWFESHADNIAPASKENYRYTLRHLKAAFDNKKIQDIKPADVEQMLRTMQKDGFSRSCISKCRGQLYQIMAKAAANDLILRNPVELAEKMRYHNLEKRKEAFSEDEVAILMERLPKDRIGISIRLMFGTGMRTQELLALEPRHIEPDGSAIHIEQAVSMVKGTAVVSVPKSRNSYRTILVPKSLNWCAVLLRQTDKKFVWEAGKKDNPCNPSYFRKQFRKALEAIPDVRQLSPHSCRHTYVSQMLALGIDLATIQSFVGHADINMTQHYAHAQREAQLHAIELLDAVFCGHK